MRCQPVAAPAGALRIEALPPNDDWSMASKGWFCGGNGMRCEPLTIHDVHSRASHGCQAIGQSNFSDVRRRSEDAFGVFGLPKYVLSHGGRHSTPTALAGCRGSGLESCALAYAGTELAPATRPQCAARALRRDVEGRNGDAAETVLASCVTLVDAWAEALMKCH